MCELPLLLTLFALPEPKAFISSVCHKFGARLVTADTHHPPFIWFEAIGTCLEDRTGVLRFVYSVENTSDVPAVVRFHVSHFTQGRIPFGSASFSLALDARETKYSMSDGWHFGPIPLRGSDVFVAAVTGVNAGAHLWNADALEVRSATRRAMLAARLP